MIQYAACETRLTISSHPPESEPGIRAATGNRNFSHLLGPGANKGTALVEAVNESEELNADDQIAWRLGEVIVDS